MWNKKEKAMEAKKIEHVEGQSPTSPYNADRELESLPHQSLVQATKVHFGARPNLQSTLLDHHFFLFCLPLHETGVG